MAAVNPYLNFNGNAEEAFNFYKAVFGKEFSTIVRFKDMDSGQAQSETDGNKIMHVSLPISSETILMASDVPSGYPAVTGGNNMNISVNTESEEEARKIFDGLSSGGKIIMVLDKTFWGALFGMFTDKFGVQWMVNYDYKKD